MKMNRLGNWLPRVSACTTTSLVLGLAMAACITRPVGTQPPTTKVNFTSTQSQQAVDKVDMLFAIDNSASMGDKQQFLALAVPTLLQGLTAPHCVDQKTGLPVDASRADPVKTKAEFYGCASVNGNQLDAEFKPVTDLHIGIVSSSLGTMGGDLNGGVSDLCPVSDTTRHYNDNGHLVPPTRTAADPNNPNSAAIVAAATAALQPASFLAWFPESEENTTNPTRHPTPANPLNNATNLQNYFQSAVYGLGQDGCGFEAQLESMYRFLIQPDPYVIIKKDGLEKADLGDGIDYDLLAQRAQFLRPDSLVAVIMLTDETDSSVDPLSVNGLGYNYASAVFLGSTTPRGGDPKNGTTAPMPTSICATDPGNANCTSCGFKAGCATGDTSALCQMLKADPNCNTTQTGASSAGYYGKDGDAMNPRMFHMKQRFGVDPQFPISRYVNGLSSGRVPDRSTEHTITTSASGVRNISAYVGTGKCTNPLFASALPTKQGDEVCNLPKGTRDASLVFYAIVGGVPNQLIYGVKDDGVTADYRPDDAEHNAMTDDKWVKVLGKNPLLYDYTGLDPHMVESITARPGISGGDPNLSPRGTNGTDPIIGREWNSNGGDLQFACTFPLQPQKPRDCSGNATTNPNYISCDCTTPALAANGFSNQPLCADGQPTSTTQTRAKAYPTVRELEVSRALGAQGITASLCPVNTDISNAASPDTTNPEFGYNPAVASIIDRLKNALTQQCLPQSLRDLPDGGTADPALLSVPCLILAQLGDGEQDCARNGLTETDPEVLKVFHDQQVSEAGGSTAGATLAGRKVCTVNQAVKPPGETCKTSPDKSWCYVENSGTSKPAGRCQQAIVFSAGTQVLAGARFSLQCIRQFSAGVAAGDTH